MSRTVSISIVASASTFFCPTPSSTETGSAASWLSRRGTRLLDAEEVGVERLAAVMDLGGDAGVMLGQPFSDATRGGGRSALALDHGDDLVVVGDERVEQPGGRAGQ